MKREIERKFLVNPHRLPKLEKGIPIVQAYFSQNPETRIRIQGKRGFITIKTSGLVSRDEYEYPIPLRDAKKLADLSNLKIEKTRFFLRLNNLKWEIDFYKEKNAGLVLAEIELPTESFEFKPPLWAVEEVTTNLHYRNQSLAKRPFTKW